MSDNSGQAVPPTGRFGFATLDRGGVLIPAVVTTEGVLTLPDLLGAGAPPSVRAALTGDWDDWCDRIEAALEASAGRAWTAVEDVVFAPPLPDASSIYLAGANYWDHILEMRAATPDKDVDSVFHFLVPTSTMVGTGHDVVRPAGVEQLDWEVELALVIGRRAERVSVADALDHVAGYAVANDISARGPSTFHPIFGLNFVHAKGQATLKPIGPCLVPSRYVPDPGSLALTTWVNGDLRQDSNTKQMVWGIEEQISHLSHSAPLEVGDLILTGTPAGTAAAHGNRYLADGDVVTASVEGLGVLRNRIVASR